MVPPRQDFKLIILLIILLFINLLQYSEAANAANYIYDICDTDGVGNYTQTSAYKTNLDHVLSDIVANASDTSFYSTSHGSGEDQVFGIFYCRFDIKPSSCHDCVQAAAKQVLQNCTVEKTAVIWYDLCTLRYANHALHSVYEETISSYSSSYMNVTNPTQFVSAVGEEMNGLIEKAAYNTSYNGHAYGVKVVSDFQKIYSFVQCRPDTTGDYCNRCLRVLVSYLASCCSGGSKRAIEQSVNCNMRYDDQNNFLEVPMDTGPAGSSPRPPALSAPSSHRLNAPPPKAAGSGGSAMTTADGNFIMLSTLASLAIFLL